MDSLELASHSPFQIIAMFYWWFWGYETFTGPRPNLAALRQARGEKADSDSEDIKDSDTKERLEE